jgi:hypothetical protein
MLAKTTINNRGRVTEHWYITDRTFLLDGHICEVIATGEAPAVDMGAKHWIKGHPEIREVSHADLVKWFKRGRVQEYKLNRNGKIRRVH